MKCPVCGRPALEDFQPFCSTRCKDVDLSRWLNGVYVIEGDPALEDAALPEEQDNDKPH